MGAELKEHQKIRNCLDILKNLYTKLIGRHILKKRVSRL